MRTKLDTTRTTIRPLVATCLIGCLGGLSGCSTIRAHRQERNLTTARQYSLRGADHLEQKNYTEAEPLFSEALRHCDADERAHWGMAEVLWNRGLCSGATQHMQRAAELSGENPDLLVRLGEMYLREGQLDAAYTQAEAVIKRSHKHPAAWALKGQVLRQQEAYLDAIDCYSRALIYKPNNPEARVALAELYHQVGRPQRALATLDQLADYQPTEQIPARAWMLKGQALAALGEHDDAKNCLRTAALCAAENECDLLINLAELQYSSGLLAEARICLGRALRNDPNNQNALALQNTLAESFDTPTRETSALIMPASWQNQQQSGKNR